MKSKVRFSFLEVGVLQLVLLPALLPAFLLVAVSCSAVDVAVEVADDKIVLSPDNRELFAAATNLIVFADSAHNRCGMAVFHLDLTKDHSTARLYYNEILSDRTGIDRNLAKQIAILNELGVESADLARRIAAFSEETDELRTLLGKEPRIDTDDKNWLLSSARSKLLSMDLHCKEMIYLNLEVIRRVDPDMQRKMAKAMGISVPTEVEDAPVLVP